LPGDVQASWEGTAHIWDGKTGKPLARLMKHSSEVLFANFSADGWLVGTTGKVEDGWSEAPHAFGTL
jgi:hypothetical protein